MKTSVTILLLQFISCIAYTQTHYGTSVGTLGSYHSYFGNSAGSAALSTSYENSFFGTSSGKLTTTGYGNTAMGFSSLRENTTGYSNVAIGSQALRFSTTGYSILPSGDLRYMRRPPDTGISP